MEDAFHRKKTMQIIKSNQYEMLKFSGIHDLTNPCFFLGNAKYPKHQGAWTMKYLTSDIWKGDPRRDMIQLLCLLYTIISFSPG